MCHSFEQGNILLYGEIEDDWNTTYDHVLMVFDLETNSLKVMKKLFVDLSSINAASDKLCLIYQQNGLPVEYDATEYKMINKSMKQSIRA